MSQNNPLQQATANNSASSIQTQSNGATPNNGASPVNQPQPTNGPHSVNAKKKVTLRERFSFAANAYLAALLFTGTIVQIFAIIATAAVYFLLPPVLYPIWYAPVGGFIVSLLLWIICAAVCSLFANAEGANPRSYGLLRMRLDQLNARLGIEQLGKEQRWTKDEGQWTVAAKMDKSLGVENYQMIALREAHKCYDEVDKMLRERRTRADWVLGMGYVNAWGLIHRAEEALIEFEPMEMVVRGAIHDKLAIQNSTIENRDELLRDIIRAVMDMNTADKGYFSEHQLDKGGEASATVLKELSFIVKKLNEIHPSQNAAINTTSPMAQDQDKLRKEAQARGRTALREIRRTLNEYRDTLWEGLVRERNHLFATIAITGSMTHLLLCIAILTVSSVASSIIVAATSFYLAGAVAGLFGKISFEFENNNAIDDYGLSVARLIAIPLLSGLAGVGGVLVTALFSGWGELQNLTFTTIFDTSPSHLVIAALFGLTPTLLVKSFHVRTNRYLSELQSSKGAVRGKR